MKFSKLAIYFSAMFFHLIITDTIVADDAMTTQTLPLAISEDGYFTPDPAGFLVKAEFEINQDFTSSIFNSDQLLVATPVNSLGHSDLSRQKEFNYGIIDYYAPAPLQGYPPNYRAEGYINQFHLLITESGDINSVNYTYTRKTERSVFSGYQSTTSHMIYGYPYNGDTYYSSAPTNPYWYSRSDKYFSILYRGQDGELSFNYYRIESSDSYTPGEPDPEYELFATDKGVKYSGYRLTSPIGDSAIFTPTNLFSGPSYFENAKSISFIKSASPNNFWRFGLGYRYQEKRLYQNLHSSFRAILEDENGIMHILGSRSNWINNERVDYVEIWNSEEDAGQSITVPHIPEEAYGWMDDNQAIHFFSDSILRSDKNPLHFFETESGDYDLFDFMSHFPDEELIVYSFCTTDRHMPRVAIHSRSVDTDTIRLFKFENESWTSKVIDETIENNTFDDMRLGTIADGSLVVVYKSIVNDLSLGEDGIAKWMIAGENIVFPDLLNDLWFAY